MATITDTMFIPISGDSSCAISEYKDATTVTRSTVASGDWDSSDVSFSFDATDVSSRSSSHYCHLQGRQAEISKIKKCFTEVAASGTAQLLLVSGVSGSGKSALVEHMRNFVTSSKYHGFFCEGKFEQSLLDGGTNEPFSALATAFSDAIDFILNNRDEAQERSDAVSKALGPNASVLTDFVPNLSLLLAAQCNTAGLSNGTARSMDDGSTKTSTRLAILFRNFLRSLTSKESPILLFLDDLQFADDDSLDVFRALVSDSLLKYVLIVGSYRSNETSMSQLLTSCSSKTVADILPTTTIHVGDLARPAINTILSHALRMDEKATAPLSEVVLQKSGGNPFYVIQYLTVLQSNHLLEYNEDDAIWTWDVDEILMTTNVSRNVLELVSQRLHGLPDEIRALLTLIAFVGFRFELELVEIILRQFAALQSTTSYRLENQCTIDKAVSLIREGESVTQRLEIIEDVLHLAIKDGLLEKCSGSIFKFTHDRIQQALYGMIKTEGGRSELHYCIGRTVSSLDLISIEEKRKNLFFVADQLNRGVSRITKEVERIELGITNLKVGKAAAARAAYQSAGSYLRSAMNLLNEEKYWSTHYSLMVDLFSSTAEIEAQISNSERSQELCELVLQRAFSLDDKVRAYVCLVSLYCNHESMDDAVRVGKEFLSQVGVRLPKNPNLAHVVLNLIQTKKCMHNVSDSMILESPMLADHNMAKAIEVLSMLATAYYIMANAGEMFAIIVMQMVQLTRRFGLAEMSAKGFAMFATLNSGLGDRNQALRYGNLALCLLQKPGHVNKASESSVLCIVYTFVKWWDISLQECTEPLLQGARVGKQQGDLAWAYFSAGGVMFCMLHSGYHLHETLEFARKSCDEMIEYGVHSALRMSIPFWQFVENLTGRGVNTYKLTGNVMDEDEIVQIAEQNKNLFALQVINSVRLCAAVVFQEWDLAAELALLVLKGIKFFDAHKWVFTVRLYLGLTFSESYLRHGKRKDLRRLCKILRELQRLGNFGASNIAPLTSILQAELVAATKPSRKVAQKAAIITMYEKALEQCYIHNLIHYRALTNERALRVCQLHQDKQGATVFMNDALNCYRDWGADAKVEQMEEIYYDLFHAKH